MEEFLHFELGSQEKHAFVQGQIFLKAGGTRRNNRIAVRLGSLLENQSQNTHCLVAIADTLVQAADTLYYPDAMLYCERAEDARVVQKPLEPRYSGE